MSIDVYSTVTFIYYILYGLLGLNTGKLFMYEIYSYMFITGVTGVLETTNLISYGCGYLYLISLSMTSCKIVIRLISEGLKSYYSGLKNKNKEKKVIYKNYYMPVGFISLSFVCYNILSIIYGNIFMTVAVLLAIQIIQVILVLWLFPIQTQHYSTVRTMLVKSLLTSLIGCVGLSTYPYTITFASDKWYFIFKIFIGLPIANTFLSYSLYITSQILTLIRAKNMCRKTIIRGTDNIYVVSYIGREGHNSRKSQWDIHMENIFNDV